MKPKLDDIRFVNQCARQQFKRELGRSLTKPELKPVKPKPEQNHLWSTQWK